MERIPLDLRSMCCNEERAKKSPIPLCIQQGKKPTQETRKCCWCGGTGPCCVTLLLRSFLLSPSPNLVGLCLEKIELREETRMCSKERSVTWPSGGYIYPSLFSPCILSSNYLTNYGITLGKKEVIHSRCSVTTLGTMRTIISV